MTLKVVRLATVALCCATPLAAQRGGQRNARAATPAPVVVQDTGKKGYALDFQDQDIRVVLSALAEAGKVNLTFNNLPARKVTLRMMQPGDRPEIVSMIKAIAEANDLKVTENGTLLQVAGPPPVATQTPAQQLQQMQAQNEMKLYTYRLKHASATQLAPVLMSLFSGATTNTGRGGVQTVNTPNGITTIFTPQQAGAAGGGAAGGRGGQGGNAAGGNAQGALGNILGGGRGGGAAQQALQNLSNLLGGGGLSSSAADVRIVGEESSNSLLVRATATDWALIQQVVGGVDARPLQVLIEVTIAEVARTNDLNVGVSGTLSNKSGNKADSASNPSAGTARDFILRLTGGHGTIDYNIAINALQERGDVRVLSLPVIIAQNNKQAILNVGSRRPFVQVSQNITTGNVPTTVQTVQYIDVGTTLTITPTINPDGYVNLTVQQTDNSATNEVTFNAPVISTREATTQVFLRDGQTTVIGGLAGKSSNKMKSGIPILSQIPIIGALFGHHSESTVTSELFLFLTPHVISDDDDIDALREAVKNGSEMLKQMPTGARIVPGADTIHVTPDSLRKRPDSTTGRGRSGGGGGR